MQKNFLLYTGLGLGVFWLFRKFSKVSRSVFQLTGFSIAGTFLQPIVIAKFQSLNPTNITSKINSIVANIYSNNVAIGLIDSRTPITINRGATNFELPIQIIYGGIVENVANLLKMKLGNYTIQGTANIDGVNVPFTINYEQAN